jgi:hypothetical protein
VNTVIRFVFVMDVFFAETFVFFQRIGFVFLRHVLSVLVVEFVVGHLIFRFHSDALNVA